MLLSDPNYGNHIRLNLNGDKSLLTSYMPCFVLILKYNYYEFVFYSSLPSLILRFIYSVGPLYVTSIHPNIFIYGAVTRENIIDRESLTL